MGEMKAARQHAGVQPEHHNWVLVTKERRDEVEMMKVDHFTLVMEYKCAAGYRQSTLEDVCRVTGAWKSN